MGKRVDAKGLRVYFGAFLAVTDVDLSIEACGVTALIGPSGTGKSTVLRTLNRLHELTPHVRRLDEPVEGVTAHQRQAQLMVEFRIPFTVTRAAVDDVDRGAKDSDWQPVKDAAQKAAEAEDRTVFHGFPGGGISGITAVSSHRPLTLASDPKKLPDSVAQALSALRLAGVGGPYALLLSADLYTTVSEETDHGYPIRDHLTRLVDGEVLWAPALDGAILLSTRGGDYTLHLGQDLSVGYLSHDAEQIQLYLEESLTFIPHTAETGIVLTSDNA